MDENYQNYVNRVANLSLITTHETQLNYIQKSAKFDQGEPAYFPGYSLITPLPEEDVINQSFYQQLAEVLENLAAQLPPNLLINIPPASFHLTIADLIWDSAYQAARQGNSDYEEQLALAIQSSFQEYQNLEMARGKIELQLVGLTIFPRAITVCLLPKTADEYEKISQLRRCIYQNPEIIGLAIEQQYSYVAHITLGYFNEIDPDLDRSILLKTLAGINEQWIAIETPSLVVEKIQLRKFDNMYNYERKPHWPELEL